ncbi:putative MFS monocarboxylate transporter [Annulohypoxylon truncatum]|uniref:putative MFS monocarboxylate transporter n=1 Tax=Annulohypoxylon truncatum TaxID=327061 RepID=UPI0020079806|nr:putative MFS monocarboxylate transporter [Annulohypoxylon truncatum]KAI1208463.1 putative MFS monocarboxylate transporter [Annulohypoxylon truncatum]
MTKYSQSDITLENGIIPSDESHNRNEEKLQFAEVAVLDEDAPPDGGLEAWLQVVGSYSLYFNTWGTINTFGVYQTYYEDELLQHMSPSAISWIGSLQSFLLLAVGVVSGPLYDAGHLRLLLCAGLLLVTLGMMMTSLCTEYWQVMLAQAVCVGVGTGCLYIPSVAIIPQYFTKRKALAMGIVTSGSSFGGVIYPLMFQGLLPRVGFGWTTRIMGFTNFATISISFLVLRRRTAAVEIRSLLDMQAFHERPYVIYCIGISLSYLAFFVPIFYLQTYALTHGLEGQTVALYLVAILNAASVLGRLTPSLIANRIGPIHTFFISITLAGVTAFSWINTDSGGGNIAFAAFFGFFTGGIVALPAVVLTSFTPDLSRLGTRLGMSSVLNGVASLIGAPIAGAILGATGNYLGIQLFAGFLFMATAAFIAVLRFVITGKKLVTRA